MAIALFTSKNFKSKIQSITYLRLLSWTIWKFLILLFLTLILSLLSSLPFLSFFLRFSFHFTSFIKLYLLFIIIDVLSFIALTSNTNTSTSFEFLSKLFLQPNQLTFCFFALVFVISVVATAATEVIIKNIDDDLNNDNDINKYVFLFYFFAICVTVSIVKKINIKSNDANVNVNRVDCFKQSLKKIIKDNIDIAMIEMFIFGTIVYIMMIDNKILINGMIIRKGIFFMNVFIYLIIMIMISLSMMKNFILAPVNYINEENRTAASLMKLLINFRNESMFMVYHYFTSVKVSIKEIDLLSKDQIEDVKKKIDYLYSRVLEKLKISDNLANNMRMMQSTPSIFSSFLSKFDFSKNEIFEKETSIAIIDILCDIMKELIVKIAKGKNSKENIINYQFYIVHFFEVMTFYERITKDIASSKNFFNNMINGESLRKDLMILNKRIEAKLQFVIKLHLARNFLMEQSKTVIDRIDLYKQL